MGDWDQIKEEMVKANVATYRKVPPEFVAIDPANRGGTMATGEPARLHGKKILKPGFSLSKASDACARNAPADASFILKENRRAESMSKGLIPPLVDAHIIASGTTHTHTLQFSYGRPRRV